MGQLTKEERVEKKTNFIERVQRLYREYRRILLVSIDHVPSNMMQTIRHALRGKAELLCGKNSLVRHALKQIGNEAVEPLIENVRLSVGLLFTNEDLKKVREIISQNKVPAPAKSGSIADLDVQIPKGNTGLEPTQTSFLQALNIATKINKGTIEIINDVTLIKKGQKVGNSEVALLAKLNILPFFYEMRCKSFFENGSLFSTDILDISDEQLLGSFFCAADTVASVSLGINMPNMASLRHIVAAGFQNVASVALASNIKLAQLERMCAAPAAAPAPAPAAAKPAKEEKPKKEEKKEEPEEEIMGMGGLFD